MDAVTQLREQFNIIHGELASRGIRSAKIDNAIYSVETLTRGYMEPEASMSWDGYGFTKKEQRIATLLHKRFGKCVSRDALLDALYFDNPNGEDNIEDPRKIVDVYICKMKPKMVNSHFDIKNNWGDGFRMVVRESMLPQNWARYGLTYRERLIASTLQARSGENVSIEELLDALYPEGRKPRKNIHIFVFRARLKLKASPFDIKYDRRLGYRMATRTISEPINPALKGLAA